MGQVTNYDPSRQSVAFMGIDVTGFMDATFIEVERNEDAFTTHVGATGDVTRVRNLNRTGKVVLTLTAAASSNGFLMAIHRTGEQFGIGDVGPLLIKDLNGNTVCRAAQAWIKKPPKIERAKEAGSCQWEFECAELWIQAGGNVI